MKALSITRRRIITIILNGKIIRISNLAIVLALFLSNAAHAADGNTQLLRNTTLEAAALDRAMITANHLKNNDKALTDAQIKHKAKELEGVFLSVMLEPMFPEGKESDLYGGGPGNGVFRTLMIQEYGKGFADAGGVGLAKGIEKQMKRQVGE